MATKLQLYNRALRNLGETKLSSLTENREPRRLLDDVYDEGGVDTVLENGLWNFAMRTQKITYNSAIEPSFGYRYAIDKPSDYIRLAIFSPDEYFTQPLKQFHDDQDYWFCDLQTVYVRYVSNDASYGGNLSAWPLNFFRYASWYFSNEIARALIKDEKKRVDVEKDMDKALLKAKNIDAMNQPPGVPAQGSWSRSRRGGGRERGNRGSLYG